MTRALASLIVLAACGRSDPSPPPEAVVRRESSLATHWESEGFIRMVPAIRGPTSNDGRMRVAVFVQIPPGGRIGGTVREGRPFAILPLGTRAVRVEYLAAAGAADDDPIAPSDRVLDVRGTELIADGQRFHVLRPSKGSLLGMEWPNDATAQAHVDQALMTWAEAGAFGAKGDRQLGSHLQRLNDCAGCHVPDRSLVPRALVKRPTDAHGFFQISSTFWDDGPFETYRPRDPNRGDPFVERRCEGNREVDASVMSCPDGAPPSGHFRLGPALAAGDRHARAVCASRTGLARAFDPSAEKVLSEAVASCAPR